MIGYIIRLIVIGVIGGTCGALFALVIMGRL